MLYTFFVCFIQFQCFLMNFSVFEYFKSPMYIVSMSFLIQYSYFGGFIFFEFRRLISSD